jgi:CBS domain-containing protein
MFVSKVLPTARQRLATVAADAAVAEVARLLCKEQVNLVVVCNDDGMMVGVITDSDVVCSLAVCHPVSGPACRGDVSGIMTRDVLSCRTDLPLREVWSPMKERGLRHVPVLDDENRPIGVLYARDVLKELVDELEFEDREMRDFFLGVGYR